jgi:hypothetical protein
MWTFELARPKKVPANYKRPWLNVLEPEIRQLNLFAHMFMDGLQYFIPLQRGIPVVLTQLLVLYTLFFWLGSVVRYDPHSVADLKDSHSLLLLEGFINQSAIWLLELFEWELYRMETTLHTVR